MVDSNANDRSGIDILNWVELAVALALAFVQMPTAACSPPTLAAVLRRSDDDSHDHDAHHEGGHEPPHDHAHGGLRGFVAGMLGHSHDPADSGGLIRL